MSAETPVIVQIQEGQIDNFITILRLQLILQKGARRVTVQHPLIVPREARSSSSGGVQFLAGGFLEGFPIRKVGAG